MFVKEQGAVPLFVPVFYFFISLFLLFSLCGIRRRDRTIFPGCTGPRGSCEITTFVGFAHLRDRRIGERDNESG